MPMSKIARVEVASLHLAVPVKDFEHLPRELGCSLQRSGADLRLATEQAGCELRFRVSGETAHLAVVLIESDIHGRFTRQVLGGLLARYQGDFDGLVTWDPPNAEPSRMVVRDGQSGHPLLARPPPLPTDATELSPLEKLLDEARLHWAEYLRLKAERVRQGDSSR